MPSACVSALRLAQVSVPTAVRPRYRPASKHSPPAEDICADVILDFEELLGRNEIELGQE